MKSPDFFILIQIFSDTGSFPKNLESKIMLPGFSPAWGRWKSAWRWILPGWIYCNIDLSLVYFWLAPNWKQTKNISLTGGKNGHIIISCGVGVFRFRIIIHCKCHGCGINVCQYDPGPSTAFSKYLSERMGLFSHRSYTSRHRGRIIQKVIPIIKEVPAIIWTLPTDNKQTHPQLWFPENL